MSASSRFLSSYTYSRLIAALVSAAHAIDSSLPAGNSSYEPSIAIHHALFDASKADQYLGLNKATYKSMEATTADIINQFKQNGWIGA